MVARQTWSLCLIKRLIMIMELFLLQRMADLRLR